MKNARINAWPGFATHKIGVGMISTWLAALVLGSLSLGAVEASAPPAIGLTQFQQLYDYSDKPVVEGRAGRSWTWGPPISDLLPETYKQGGTRQVQYFDKTRMEQTTGRPVTNGLLVKELITGLLQVGDNDFEQHEPGTTLNIVGDQASNVPNPTYASFRKVATINDDNKATNRTNQTVTATINRDGVVGDSPDLGTQYNVKNAYFDTTLSHNIPGVFWDFLNQTGPVYKNNQYVTDKVFDWLSTTGLPLTEAYWTKAVVGGKTLDVLVQAFERRVLTYTPSNPTAYQVEMGNVGQHYLSWRTEVIAPKPTPTPEPTPTPTPTPPPGPQPLAALPTWNAPTRLVPSLTVLFRPNLEVRPTDGVVFAGGESGAADKLWLTNSRDFNSAVNIHETAPNGSKHIEMAFSADGTGYFVWRQFKESIGYFSYLRKILPDGSLPHGMDLTAAWYAAGGSDKLDGPDIAISPKNGKIYITGQVNSTSNGIGIGFAESNNGAASLTGVRLLAGLSRVSGEIDPQICVDKDDNIHIIGFWNGNVAGISRINGNWTGLQVLTDSKKVDFLFRGQISIGCSQDGYAYGVFKGIGASNNGLSIGLVRYAPGEGWRLMGYDLYGAGTSDKFAGGNIPNTDAAAVVVTPDNRVWVAATVNYGQYAGVLVANSSDRGVTFGNLQVPIAHPPTGEGIRMVYSSFGNKMRLHIIATFKEPSDRVTYYVSTQ
jgi:hypothetical protein